MSSVMPSGKVEKVQFCEDHIDPWTTNAATIGTTAAAVTDLATKTTAARAAFQDQQAAQQAAKDATVNLDLAVRAMADAAAGIIKQVRAKAATGGGDAIYALASIPVPAAPGPIGPLGKPSDFKVTLSESGALELSWKCTNPRGATGTIYQVWRRVGAATDFSYVGGTGTKGFVDATLPAGSTSVTYQIQAVRSTSVGPWAQFNVNFGVGGAGGAMTASVVEGVPAKIAA